MACSAESKWERASPDPQHILLIPFHRHGKATFRRRRINKAAKYSPSKEYHPISPFSEIRKGRFSSFETHSRSTTRWGCCSKLLLLQFLVFEIGEFQTIIFVLFIGQLFQLNLSNPIKPSWTWTSFGEVFWISTSRSMVFSSEVNPNFLATFNPFSKSLEKIISLFSPLLSRWSSSLSTPNFHQTERGEPWVPMEDLPLHLYSLNREAWVSSAPRSCSQESLDEPGQTCG